LEFLQLIIRGKIILLFHRSQQNEPCNSTAFCVFTTALAQQVLNMFGILVDFGIKLKKNSSRTSAKSYTRFFCQQN
ncbi:MAG: hypothetical protein RBR47_11565, partial [Bacteroidales bacterium]|nr:hypothetical protein [Bacteroidales bacterium]